MKVIFSTQKRRNPLSQCQFLSSHSGNLTEKRAGSKQKYRKKNREIAEKNFLMLVIEFKLWKKSGENVTSTLSKYSSVPNRSLFQISIQEGNFSIN